MKRAAAARLIGILALALTTDAPTASQVLGRFGDPRFALGRAVNIGAIAGAFCPAECGL
jgi:hypothetical protein